MQNDMRDMQRKEDEGNEFIQYDNGIQSCVCFNYADAW